MKKQTIYQILMYSAIFFSISIVGCKPTLNSTLAKISYSSIDSITEISAVAKYNTETSGTSAAPTAQGAIFSKNPDLFFGKEGSTAVGGKVNAAYWGVKLTNLKPNTLYYVKGFVTNNIGTAYSVETYFITK